MIKRIIIGTSANCDFKVLNKTVSRQHAELILKEDGRCLLIDRKSTNGTYVLDPNNSTGWKQITQALVDCDDDVRLGTLKLNLQTVLKSTQESSQPKKKREIKSLSKKLPKPDKFFRNEAGQIVPKNKELQ